MTPKQKATEIDARMGPKWTNLIREAIALASSPKPLSEKADRIYGITDELAGFVQPFSPCKRGCSYCCHMAVGISELEAQRIAARTGRVPKDAGRSYDAVGPQEIAEMQRQYSGVPCTFLDPQTGECTIYEDRPLACRTNFNLGEEPRDCDISTNPGGQVPNLNFTSLWQAQALIAFVHDLRYADIREFFPKENANAANQGSYQS